MVVVRRHRFSLVVAAVAVMTTADDLGLAVVAMVTAVNLGLGRLAVMTVMAAVSLGLRRLAVMPVITAVCVRLWLGLAVVMVVRRGGRLGGVMVMMVARLGLTGGQRQHGDREGDAQDSEGARHESLRLG
jgi:hypothetical protein